jgi:hypothetical protein
MQSAFPAAPPPIRTKMQKRPRKTKALPQALNGNQKVSSLMLWPQRYRVLRRFQVNEQHLRQK